jgi:AcrR family transcriptional regulator
VTDPVSGDRTATQRAVLTATLELIDEGGEPAVRVAEVARRAGVTTGAIYSNFESREGLIAAAHIAHMEREVRDDMVTRIAADDRTSGHAEADVEWRAQAMEIFGQPGRVRRRRWAEAALMAHRNDELAEAMIPIAREALEHVVEQIKHAQEMGWVRKDLDPQAMAVFRLGTTLGVGIMAGVYTPFDPDFTDKLIAAWPAIATAFDIQDEDRTGRGDADPAI